MSNNALRKNWSRQFANDLVRSLNESDANNYYLFVGKITAWDDESVPPTEIDSDFYGNDAWRNALALKRLDADNIMLVVPRINWTSGIVYQPYDAELDLHDSANLLKYYVITDTFKVYKCIGNNGAGQSTVQPSHTTHHIVTESDGYRWKFLYELTEIMRNFMTDEYIPVKYITQKNENETINQLQTQEYAIDGTVDYATVTSVGNKVYSSSVTTSTLFGGEFESGATRIRLNQSASNIGQAYKGYCLYIDDGRRDEIGKIREITDYDGQTKIATISSPIGAKIYLPDTEGRKGSSYKILPLLKVHGDGEGCQAIPDVNTANEINGIKIVTAGSGYKDTRVEVVTTAASGTTDSVFKLYVSPNGGHGVDATRELQATRAMILMSADEGDKDSDWPAENDFRQFGIVKNPILNLPDETTVAGNEWTRTTELVILKPYGVTASYNYDSVDGTYKVGNSIIGSETQSTAKILSFKDEPDSDYSIIDIENIRGKFAQANPLKDEYRFVMNSVVGSFIDGETVTQYVGSTTDSGSTAEGLLRSFQTSPHIELVVTGVTGAWSGSTGDIVGTCSGASAGAGILSFQVAGGELIKQFQTDSTGDFSYVTIDVDNKQDYGRIVQQNTTKIDLGQSPTYRLTHKLQVTGTGFTDTYFGEDTGVTQEHPVFATETSSRVAWFKAHSGTTGDLYVSNVLGGFTTGSTLETAPSVSITVNKVIEPEVVLGSGELLYIQNIRPVERIREQEEEFKILLGF
tara:strand:+ start:2953 stop:5193 length:2241 start_codon:yes stop_codon:yes gene_type:complete